MSENVRKNGRPAAVLALASGEAVAAARKAGVTERTLHRWRQDESFRREVTQARADMFSRALGCVAEGSASGALMLRQLALKAKSESVKLAAARALLELGPRMRESVELEERLRALVNMRGRLMSLERGLPPAAPRGEPEPVALPPLAEFRAMTLERQRHVLLCWDPPPSGVTLPPAGELERMPTEDLKRLIDEMERPGREALLPYAESLPFADRIQLLRDATQLPGCEIWRLHMLRFACRPEWRRRLDGSPDQRETRAMPQGTKT